MSQVFEVIDLTVVSTGVQAEGGCFTSSYHTTAAVGIDNTSTFVSKVGEGPKGAVKLPVGSRKSTGEINDKTKRKTEILFWLFGRGALFSPVFYVLA